MGLDTSGSGAVVNGYESSPSSYFEDDGLGGTTQRQRWSTYFRPYLTAIIEGNIKGEGTMFMAVAR